MSFAHLLDRLDARQQRSRAVAVPVAVLRKFIDDGADSLGVQVAYWGFFSVFALLLVFVSILVFAFQSDPDFQTQVLDSALADQAVGVLVNEGVAPQDRPEEAFVDRREPRHYARTVNYCEPS